MMDHKYMARVFIAQARSFRQHPGFPATLLSWAAERRRRARMRRVQLELF